MLASARNTGGKIQMTYKEVLQAAQGQMGPCRACPVCNGRACGGTIPGPGAKGSGTVAVRNFDAWRNVRLNMDTIHEILSRTHP